MIAEPDYKDFEAAVGLDLGIGTRPAELRPDEMEPVSCTLCGTGLVPNTRADVFTLSDSSLVCDACTARLRPDLLALVDRLRSLDGAFDVRQVRLGDATTALFRCATCGRHQVPEGWQIVESASFTPICNACALDRVSGEVRDLWKGIRTEERRR